ncbi:hypothetical protein [Pseudanabaena phage PA-SR01]|nr:hypothetical protein [Pseudanabaena phage PA-SR01]
MNNRVLKNFRDHPALRFDDEKLVFKIDDKVYLISGSVVRQILPQSITATNIGDPYRLLVRLRFYFADEAIQEHQYEEIVDFAPEHTTTLRELL